MPLNPGEYIYIDLPEQYCPLCDDFYSKIGVSNEVVFTDENELLGVEAVIRFEQCGHRVPNSIASPVSVAMMLDNMEDLGE